jgi:hypothetical protein
VSAFARRLERSVDHQAQRFDPWYFGIPQLDQVVRGVRPGFTNLIVARPHVGKTLLAIAGIRNNPTLPTLFISADDDPDVVVRKMMEFDGVVEDGWKATSGQMSAYIGENYPNLDIVDDVTWGPAAYNGRVSLADAVERFQDAYSEPPGLIVYDYLGIDGSDFAGTVMVSSWMKESAKTLPMPILTIAQSNRQSGGKTTKDGDRVVRRGFRMEDLSYGGEQQAGLMIGLTAGVNLAGGAMRSSIEIDVVKNKAVFDGSGITHPEQPVVLFHQSGRLVDKTSMDNMYYSMQELQQQQMRNDAHTSGHL